MAQAIGNDISQGFIYTQFNKYLFAMGQLEGKPRQLFINAGGDCNGWAMLFAYYSNTAKGQEFKDILTYISSWDGKLSSLNQNTKMSALLKNKYGSGKVLFEQMINNVTWFSQIKTQPICPKIDGQSDRVAQWQIVKSKKIELKSIFSFKKVYGSLDKASLVDLLDVAGQWKDTWLDIGVYCMLGGHALSVYITSQGKYQFYDCNSKTFPVETASSLKVATDILSALSPSSCIIGDISSYKFYHKDKPFDEKVIDINPNKANYKAYETFLHFALAKDQLNVVYPFLKINNFIESMSTSLMQQFIYLACQKSNESIMSVFIGKSKTQDLEILKITIEQGYYDGVKLLLSHHVPLNTQFSGTSALILCLKYNANKNFQKIFDLLLEHSADTNIKDSMGETALMIACSNTNCTNISQLLEHGAKLDIQDYQGWSALFKAVYFGKHQAVSLLLEHGADTNIKNNNGETALMIACGKANYINVVSQLLDHGAEINILDKQGSSALFKAVSSDNKQVVSLLLEHGADANIKDNNGETALFKIYNNGSQIQMASLLIDHGADLNIQDKQGFSALIKAVCSYNVKMVSFLLEQGADTTLHDNLGCTAKDYAIKSGYQTLISLFNTVESSIQTDDVLLKDDALIFGKSEMPHTPLDIPTFLPVNTYVQEPLVILHTEF